MSVILLVEDSPTERTVFVQWLENAGHEVIVADNAEDGLEIIRELMPDLVLMDVVLPGMSGFQATRTMANDEAMRHIPVLIVSTKGLAADREWGLRQGATDYFVKPPREKDLIARINQLVC
jgi:twitching motility two-component system response regulator PilH